MKKTKMIVALLIASLMVFTVVLSACKHTHEFSEEWSSDATNHWHKATCEHTDEVADLAPHTWGDDGKCTVCGRDKSQQGIDTADTFMELDDYKAYLKSELKANKDTLGAISTKVDADIEAAYTAGIAAINAGTSVSTVRVAFDNANRAIASCIPLANGAFDFTGLSQAQKTEILGLLEAYAIREGLTGVSFYSNGAYVMYGDRVTLGTENYITGYGFGALTEGSLKAPLANESNEAWKMYYHSINAQNPQHMNTLNDKGSETSDFYSYISGAYYTTFMNETKDGYNWLPELAVSNPEPVGALNDAGQTDHWRFEIRKGVKYSTLSSDPARAAFNDREIALEDYITPFKLLLNAGNNYFRGEELSNATGASSIVGAKEYFAATSGKSKGILSEEEAPFENVVKVKAYEEDGKWYFEYTLGAKVNAWYARYYINSSLYMTIPEDFIKLVGVDAYLGKNEDGSKTPVDNSLSLGAYTAERWEDMQIVYKKNPNYVYADSKYQIAGVHIRIYPAVLTDTNAAFEYFINGNTDAASIPPDYLDQYVNDPRTRTTADSSVFKLNFNALDQDTWEYYFGVDGAVKKTPENKYWECEPAMSNSHFRSALSYAINRNEFAVKMGRASTVNFFPSNYLSDPENNIAYNNTAAHQKAIAPLLDGTDSGGYSLELARDYFRMALDELESSGAITRGTKANPKVIEIEIAWQSASDEDDLHAYIKQYWEDAFNDDSVHGGCYKLNVKFWVGNTWEDVYYEKMMVGQFDVGMGGITGNSQDPLGFMEVLSSDPTISGSFTLNWAIDTNDPNAGLLVYNGMRWSYDALLESTQAPQNISAGRLTDEAFVFVDGGEFSIDQSGNVVATLSYHAASGITIEAVDFVLYGYTAPSSSGYVEWSIKEYLQGQPVLKDGVYTCTLVIPAKEFEQFHVGLYGNIGIDLYASISSATLSKTELFFVDGWGLEFAEAVDEGEFEVGEDGKVTATLTVAVIDGIQDLLTFVVWGYQEPVSDDDDGYVEYVITTSNITDNGDGTLTFVFEIETSVFESFLAGEDQGIDLWVILDGDYEDDFIGGLLGGWEYEFVAAPEA